MRRRRRSPNNPLWQYVVERLRIIPAVIAVAFGAIVFVVAQETERYSEAAAMIDHVAPRSPAEVAPGDVIVVSGILHSDFKPTPSENEPGFGDVFKVKRVLERKTKEWSGRKRRTSWKEVGSFAWTAPHAQMGPWTLTAAALAGAKTGARAGVPMVEFTPSRQSNAGDIKIDGSYIYYTSREEQYRLSYQVWQADEPYSIVAVVDQARQLAPVELGHWQSRITILTPGKLSDAAISRENMLKRRMGVLIGLLCAVALFWWGLGLVHDDMGRRGKVIITLLVAGPLAATIASPVIAMPAVLALPIAASGLALLLAWLFLMMIYLCLRVILGLY
jgi:hypothetical protein